MADVLCLRPLKDFQDVGVEPPASLDIQVMEPGDAGLADAISTARALVIPAVGPWLDTKHIKGSSVRLVQITGAGVDRVDVAALAQLGIPVANVPGGSAAAVAEYAITASSALLRFLPESTCAIRAGDYSATRQRMIARGLNQLSGLVVGIVGYGVIGRATAQRFIALGAQVIFFDPMVEGGVALADVLMTADIVSLHVPLLDSTRALVGEGEIASMKPGAILVNAARGGVVDEAALAAALESGHLGGAAIDVYSSEPPAPDNPLLSVGPEASARLILTPHIAGVTRQAWSQLFSQAWENVVRVLVSGKPARNVVNQD